VWQTFDKIIDRGTEGAAFCAGLVIALIAAAIKLAARLWPLGIIFAAMRYLGII
jgi:hypothetical protein